MHTHKNEIDYLVCFFSFYILKFFANQKNVLVVERRDWIGVADEWASYLCRFLFFSSSLCLKKRLDVWRDFFFFFFLSLYTCPFSSFFKIFLFFCCFFSGPFVLRLVQSLDSFSFLFPFFFLSWIILGRCDSFSFSSRFLFVLVHGARCDNINAGRSPLSQPP